MSARLAAFSAALLLTACATAQENPNYRYSSKYGSPDTGVTTAPQPVQTAQYPQDAAPVQANYPQATYSEPATPETSYSDYSGVTVQPAPTYAQDTIIASNPVSVSPTEQAYDTESMVGTPGYSVYVPENAPVTASTPTPVPQTPGQSRAIDYDYSQNMRGAIGAPAPAPAPAYAASPAIGGNYTVQPGDTVYSMARRLCVPLSDITSANGIGATYAINIGQTLTLPASSC